MSTVPPEPYLWTPEALTYVRTTTYHWPNFNENATDIEGEWTNSEGIGTGPFGFGSDVKLTDTSVSGEILDRDVMMHVPHPFSNFLTKHSTKPGYCIC